MDRCAFPLSNCEMDTMRHYLGRFPARSSRLKAPPVPAPVPLPILLAAELCCELWKTRVQWKTPFLKWFRFCTNLYWPPHSSPDRHFPLEDSWRVRIRQGSFASCRCRFQQLVGSLDRMTYLFSQIPTRIIVLNECHVILFRGFFLKSALLCLFP